ncbi:MAG TPA: squalene/phytoene synthase family protein, partial [Gemmatimonadales bacterium]|nr:squalene/phytoene synthase family protein [Gemmatimonadales bacterium]
MHWRESSASRWIQVWPSPCAASSRFWSDRVVESRSTEPPAGQAKADQEFCERILPQVSRTFALGIRLLPPALSESVATAYLLCRIADTI